MRHLQLMELDNRVIVLSTMVYQDIDFSPHAAIARVCFLRFLSVQLALLVFLSKRQHRRHFAFWVLVAVALDVNHISGVVRDDVSLQ